MARSLFSFRTAFQCLLLKPVVTSNVQLPLLTSCGPLAAKNILTYDSGTSFFARYKHSSAGAGSSLDLSKMNDDEWKKRLTPEQFAVCRLSGTEPPFSGEFTDHSAPGTYSCIACATPLFSSVSKFHSGCGWPAFSASIASNVERHPDASHGMTRIEVKCAKCKSHLGHVFNDGPPPTGERYCINSVCLRFLPRDGGQT